MAARNPKTTFHSVGANPGSVSGSASRAAVMLVCALALSQLPCPAESSDTPQSGAPQSGQLVTPVVVPASPGVQIVAPVPLTLTAPAAITCPLPGSAPASVKVSVPVSVPVTESGELPDGVSHKPHLLTQDGKVRDTRPPFPIASKFSRTIQTVTGVNLVSSLIVQVVASKVAEKKLGGHCKVKLREYSFTDLLAGKVKTVTIKGRGCSLKQVPLGSVVATSSPFWFDWRKRNGKVGGLNTPLMFDLVGELRQEEVCKALATEALANSMRGLKLDLPGLGEQQLQILQPKVALGDRRITIDAVLITKDASPDTGINLTISAVPLLQGSKIVLTETRVSCPDILDPENFAKFTEDLFNPLIDFRKYDRSDHAFRLDEFVVERDKVKGVGNLLLVPRSALARKTSGSGQSLK